MCFRKPWVAWLVLVSLVLSGTHLLCPCSLSSLYCPSVHLSISHRFFPLSCQRQIPSSFSGPQVFCSPAFSSRYLRGGSISQRALDGSREDDTLRMNPSGLGMPIQLYFHVWDSVVKVCSYLPGFDLHEVRSCVHSRCNIAVPRLKKQQQQINKTWNIIDVQSVLSVVGNIMEFGTKRQLVRNTPLLLLLSSKKSVEPSMVAGDSLDIVNITFLLYKSLVPLFLLLCCNLGGTPLPWRPPHSKK